MFALYIFSIMFFYKLISNIIFFFNNERLLQIWLSFFAKDNSNAFSYKQQIIDNFKRANIKDTSQPITVPTGYFQVVNTTYSTFDNIFLNDKRTASLTRDFFLEAKGVYRKRIFESFNPLYWINLIIFLPKNIIAFLGLNSDTIFTKISQLIFWFIDSVLIVKYQDKILEFIKTIFQ